MEAIRACLRIVAGRCGGMAAQAQGPKACGKAARPDGPSRHGVAKAELPDWREIGKGFPKQFPDCHGFVSKPA
ncbi:hypothetical protein [Rhizobium sp. GCM10022189]|uniref:hypothetical protein n=1 Tax=Rhizobium sp. GCM10022189 TaxID=3252654 RepID=UPI0013AE93B1